MWTNDASSLDCGKSQMQCIEKWLAQLIARGMCLGKIVFMKMVSTKPKLNYIKYLP